MSDPASSTKDLLCEALSKSRVQLGFDDRGHSEDEGGAEPEDLARVLEASNLGPLAISQMEAKLSRRGEELPSTPPAVLRRPLLDDYRRVVAWLGGSQPAAERRRLYTVAAQLAGMAGTVFFDLREPARAEAYYHVALKATRPRRRGCLPTSVTSKPTGGPCRRRYRLFKRRQLAQRVAQTSRPNMLGSPLLRLSCTRV